MFLKNYTSEIHQDTTISRIERLLVNAGATGIQKLYYESLRENRFKALLPEKT